MLQRPGSEFSSSCSLSSAPVSARFSLAGFWALIGSLGGGPVPAADVTMDDPRKKMCLQKPSSQTRPKCSLIWKFPSLNQMIIDLRTEHVSLWLLGFEKQGFTAAPEKPRGGAGDGM